MTQVLLVSTYAQGHQPLALANAAAALRCGGHTVNSIDLSIDSPEVEAFRSAELVAISVPMHTAARLGVALARRVRQLNPDATIAFYGLYASELYAHVVPEVADAVIGGEYERGLIALAGQAGDGRADLALVEEGVGRTPRFDRDSALLPDRRGLPALDRYVQFESGPGERVTAGYVEASRGCAHTCRHCPITPVYAGRLRLVAAETVLADARALIERGARHISFGDPDFLNAVPHSLAIVEALHGEWPEVSFDATIKVEHLLEHAEVLPLLREAGCAFVTSAFESVDDGLLALFDKGHTRADMDRALELTRAAGLAVRPTWLPFTPWTSAEEFAEILRFVEAEKLIGAVPAVQYALRLLVPPGSPLVEQLRSDGFLRGFDEDGLTHEWQHPEPAMDELQGELARLVEAATRDEEPASAGRELFAQVKQLTSKITGVALSPRAPAGSAFVPGLTEAWFC